MLPIFLTLLTFSGGTPAASAPLDLDLDGRPDLAWIDSEGVLRALRGDGAGGFEPVETALALEPAGQLVWQDLDADGDLDLLSLGSGAARLFENRGQFLFVEVPAAGGLEWTGPAELQWTDLDADGDLDLFLHGPAGARVFLVEDGLRLRAAGGSTSGGSSSATLGTTVTGTTAVGGLPAAAPPQGLCAGSLFDMALGGCITASSLAVIGELYPLSLDFNVDPGTGFVGMGTASPADRLHVAGVVRAQGGLRFGDGSLQTSAFNKLWSQLVAVPPGFADGIDNDTLYAAGLGLSLSAGLFGFDTGFGDARYWNESQILGGDLAGTAGTAVVDGLQGRGVSSAAPSTNHVLKWNGSLWAPAVDVDTNTTYGAGTGLALTGTTFSIAGSGVGATQLASDANALDRVSGGGARMIGGALSVNTLSNSARVNVAHASSTASPHLRLLQEGASAFSRLKFSNVASPSDWLVAGGLGATADTDRLNFWHSTAGDVLSISGQGRVGVQTTAPLTALHVNGSLHLQGTSQDISVQAGEQLQFGHFDGNTFSERMRIDGAGTLHVNGDIQLPVTTRTLLISANDFTSHETGYAVIEDTTGDGSRLTWKVGISPINNKAIASAPVHLPDGAVITRLEALIVDLVPESVSATLWSSTFATTTTQVSHASVQSNVISPALVIYSDSSIVDPVVNNSTRTYRVRVEMPIPPSAQTLAVYSVRVTYTVQTPLY